jgi:hypothetical protein
MEFATYPAMFSIESLDIDTIELTHSFTKIGIRSFDQQIDNGTHQTMSIPPSVTGIADIIQQFQKLLSIIILINIISLISSRGDVEKRPGKFQC